MNVFPESEIACPANPKWEALIHRQIPLYKRNMDIRSEFERDYTRILYSDAYRRLKHKTQVFFSPKNDHICTRIEHIMNVESISSTIAKALGLNRELTKVIATAHDLGHSPFGHQGEKILSELSEKELGKPFWHERNGLDMVDKIELLENEKDEKQNLDLTYAVRDGIISHCGEIDETFLKPRTQAIDLACYQKPNQYPPYTWEGCIVKIADKISYVRRDIEDAISLGLLEDNLEELYDLIHCPKGRKINNTNFINDLIYDLIHHSSVEEGLRFSEQTTHMLNDMKHFNYEKIYLNSKLDASHRYCHLILTEIFSTLRQAYQSNQTLEQLHLLEKDYPELVTPFVTWLERYLTDFGKKGYLNEKLFDLMKEQDYIQALLYYISGMTDSYAIQLYQSIISF